MYGKLAPLIIASTWILTCMPLDLIYTTKDNIICLSPYNSSHKDPAAKRSGLKIVNDVVYDENDDSLFYICADSWDSDKSIKRTKLYNRSAGIETIAQASGVSGDIEQLAIDWITKKIYFRDVGSHNIELTQYDGSFRRVLVSRLDRPGGLALLPQRGLMFVADVGDQPRIYQYYMDGSNQEVLSTEIKIQYLRSIGVDPVTQILYWGSLIEGSVFSLDINDRTMKREIKDKQPFYLSVFNDLLFFADSVSSIHMINTSKETDTEPSLITDKADKPKGLFLFSKKSQPFTASKCLQNNGGCSHLCLLTPTGRSCACPTGIRLLNRTTCASKMHQFLLVARKPDIRIMSLDADEKVVMVVPIKGIKQATGLDYDPVDEKIYWTDPDTKSISRAFLNGTGVEHVITKDIQHPDHVAVDWISRNLYWTDQELGRIEVARLDGSARKIIVSDLIEKPRGIIVDPPDGKIYWTDWGNFSKIERADVDGENREVLVDSDIKWPNGIALDYQMRRLYWVDAQKQRIERLSLEDDPKDMKRTTLSNHPSDPFGLTILGDYVYWTDRLSRKVNRLSLVEGDEEPYEMLTNVADVMGIKAVDTDLSYGTNVACRKDNNGCSHFCFHKPKKGAICGCPTQMELTKDGKTCKIPSGFLLYSVPRAIKKMSIDTQKKSFELPLGQADDLSYLETYHKDNLLFWLDDSRPPTINRMFLNGSGYQPVINTGLVQVTGLSVDWMAGNLYWTTSDPERIEVSRLNGTYRKVLLYGKDVEGTTHVTVNPHTRKIYWYGTNNSQAGESQSLLRGVIWEADLLGTNRHVIVKGDGLIIGSITIDYDSNIMYWVSHHGDKIESFDPITKKRAVILESQPKLSGLLVFNSKLYYCNLGKQFSQIITRNLSGTNPKDLAKETGIVMDIKASHASLQKGTNVCSENNGGCQQLCFATSQTERSCGCATLYTLSKDKVNCIAPSKFLLYSDATAVYRRLFMTGPPEAPLPIHNAGKLTVMDYDILNDALFWLGPDKKFIFRQPQNGGKIQSIELLGGSDPYDFAYEPYSGAVFVTDQKNNHIVYYRLAVPDARGVIFDGAAKKFRPRKIVVFPEKDRLFWTNPGVGGDGGTIESISLAGSDRSTVARFSSHKSRIIDLAIDYVAERIYWIDSKGYTIESCTISGTDRKKHVFFSKDDKPVSLTFHDGNIYWVDQNSRLIMKKADKDKSSSRFQGGHKNLKMVLAVNTSRANAQHPCLINNGGCSHICRINKQVEYADSGTFKAVCACPLNQVPDNKTCKEFKCSDKTEYKCIHDSVCINRTHVCDMKEDCPDGADEEIDLDGKPCNYLRPPCIHNFQCGLGCIASELVCNGKRECRDGEDEEKTMCTCPEETHPFFCGYKKPCIKMSQVCNQYEDCPDGRDERMNCTKSTTGPPVAEQKKKSRVVAGIISGVIICFAVLMFMVLLWFKLRHSKQNAAAQAALTNGTAWHMTSLAGYKTNSIISDGSMEKSRSMDTYVSSDTPPSSEPPTSFYDRNHVTGASSSSAISGYSHVPLNPPPSPLTERAMSTITEANIATHNEPNFSAPAMTCERCYRQILEQVPLDLAADTYGHGAPPPTPASTTLADDTTMYYPQQEEVRPFKQMYCKKCRNRTKKNRSSNNTGHNRLPPPLYRSTDPMSPLLLDTYADTDPLHKMWQDMGHDSGMGYESSTYPGFSAHSRQHFAPPPTPCTTYMSEVTYASEDDVDGPPSPTNTEPSFAFELNLPPRYFAHYAPPPSPTSVL